MRVAVSPGEVRTAAWSEQTPAQGGGAMCPAASRCLVLVSLGTEHICRCGVGAHAGILPGLELAEVLSSGALVNSCHIPPVDTCPGHPGHSLPVLCTPVAGGDVHALRQRFQ